MHGDDAAAGGAPAEREPPHVGAAAAEEQDHSPSLRFRIFFTAMMLLIALGYTWVWRAKTERVEAEPPPVLALGGVESYIDEGEGEVLGTRLLSELQRIRGLTVLDARVRRPAQPAIEQMLHAELRQGGAGHVLELRRVDVESGDEIYVYRVEGATFDEAVYRMSVQVAMSFGLPRPAVPAEPRAR